MSNRFVVRERGDSQPPEVEMNGIELPGVVSFSVSGDGGQRRISLTFEARRIRVIAKDDADDNGDE